MGIIRRAAKNVFTGYPLRGCDLGIWRSCLTDGAKDAMQRLNAIFGYTVALSYNSQIWA